MGETVVEGKFGVFGGAVVGDIQLRSGPLAVTIYEATYDTCVGSTQTSSCWMRKAGRCSKIVLQSGFSSPPNPLTGKLQRSTNLDLSRDADNYTSSPTSLKRIREPVATHGDSQ